MSHTEITTIDAPKNCTLEGLFSICREQPDIVNESGKVVSRHLIVGFKHDATARRIYQQFTDLGFTEWRRERFVRSADKGNIKRDSYNMRVTVLYTDRKCGVNFPSIRLDLSRLA